MVPILLTLLLADKISYSLPILGIEQFLHFKLLLSFHQATGQNSKNTSVSLYFSSHFHFNWLLTGLHGLSTLGLRLQLILQWVTGIFVLISCFLERKRYSVDISSKLGSSFSLVPFVIVVVSVWPLLICYSY